MGKRIEVEPYRPDNLPKYVVKPGVTLVVTNPGSSVTVFRYKYGSPEHLAHKRALKAAQMRRYRAKKAGK